MSARSRAGALPSAPVAVGGLTLAALALRLAGVDQSLFGDELFSYYDVHGRSLAGTLHAVRTGYELNPPLYFVLAWLFAQVGDAHSWIRVPSVLAGTAVVPLVFALGRRAAGDLAAVVASAVVALAPFAVYYGTEARAYALLMLLVTGSALALLAALDRGGRRRWALYAVLCCATLYTHYLGAIALAVQGLWALVTHRDRARPLLVASALAVVGYLPWLPGVSGKGYLWVFPRFTGSVEQLTRPLGRTLPGHPYAEPADLLGRVPALVAAAVLAGALVAGALTLVRARRRLYPSLPLALVVVLALGYLAGVLAYAAISRHDLFVSRNLAPAFVPVAILIGAGLRRLGVRAGALAAALLLAVLTYGSLREDAGRFQRPAFKDAAAAIDDQARPNDVVLHVTYLSPRSELNASPLNRDLTVNFERPQRVFQSNRSYDQAWAAALRGRGRLFTVAAGVGPRPPTALRMRFRLESVTTFDGIGPLRLYVWRARA